MDSLVGAVGTVLEVTITIISGITMTLFFSIIVLAVLLIATLVVALAALIALALVSVFVPTRYGVMAVGLVTIAVLFVFYTIGKFARRTS